MLLNNQFEGKYANDADSSSDNPAHSKFHRNQLLSCTKLNKYVYVHSLTTLQKHGSQRIPNIQNIDRSNRVEFKNNSSIMFVKHSTVQEKILGVLIATTIFFKMRFNNINNVRLHFYCIHILKYICT